MEIGVLLYTAIGFVCSIIISFHGWKFLKWAWFDPKKQEKQLRQQGFIGTSYRFLIGDYKDITRKDKQVQANPIPFNNDIAERTMAFFYEAIQKYGENCFIWFGTTASLMISDPEMIKEILTKNYVFQKMNSPATELVAQGVALYETDKWAKHRRLLNPAFHLEKIKTMVPAFHQSSIEMLSKWEKMAPKEESSWEIDVWPYLQTLTSDAISRTAFGSSYEEGRKIFELQTELLTLLLNTPSTFLIPGWRFLPTKANRKMKAISKEVESLILGIIDKRMQKIEAGEATSDLLGVLLESNSKEIHENGNDSGMSFKDVIEECKLFYIAGQTTTASLLVWTMVLLAKHVDWQARVRDEVRQVFPDNNLLDFQKFSHMKVMTMIFNEVLRLYPPGLLLSRMVHTDTKLKSITVPAGVQLILPAILLHTDVNAWGPDAKEFNPERFSEGISKATKEQYSYFPFGGGPRICIGQSFALLEAKIALSMILQRFTFEVSPSYAHAPTSGMTLLPQYGAQLIFSKI